MLIMWVGNQHWWSVTFLSAIHYLKLFMICQFIFLLLCKMHSSSSSSNVRWQTHISVRRKWQDLKDHDHVYDVRFLILTIIISCYSNATIRPHRSHNCQFPWGSGPHHIHGSLGLRISSPNGTPIDSVVLQGSRLCPTDTHRQTDHATSVTVSHILCYA